MKTTVSEGNVARREAGPASLLRYMRTERWDSTRWVVFALAGIVLAPLCAIFGSFAQPELEIWTHIAETRLGELALNTAKLTFGVGSITLVLGVSLAWLTAQCDFPGKRFFSWALLLPMAMPAYVLAFTFLGMLDFSGPVQTLLRELFGRGVWFPDIRSAGGVSTVLSLCLFPYVYLLTRTGFATQGTRALEAAQSLGVSRFGGFWRVSLPMSRPWIAGGLALVLMETLADFGAVSIFNYDTFTTAVYQAWFGFFSLAAAAQLASVLVVLALVLITLEHRFRSRMRFHPSGRSTSDVAQIKLRGFAGWSAFGYCASVLTVAFVLPVVQLVVWSWEVFAEELSTRYLGFLANSVGLALAAVFLILAASVVAAYGNRKHRDPLTRGAVRLSTLGYALPGTVLAVGIFMPVAGLDNLMVELGASWFGIETSGFLKGTVTVMLLAYFVRFHFAGYSSVDSALGRVTPNLDEAARLTGLSGTKLLGKVHLPIIKGGLLTAATLVFVDVMKEMPITLMTRPFGWDTLAVKVFELTSEGEWERAALPALSLVAAGLLPLVLMGRYRDGRRKV